MKKNKLFILSSILIIISLFTTAAACNLCGVPVEIGEATTEETEAKQQTTRTTQGQSQGTDAPQSTEAPAEGNNPPVIVEVQIQGGDIPEEIFDEPFIAGEVKTFPINFTATDEDGDELQYSAYDSLDNNIEVTKIDNNNAMFHHGISPEVGPYTITVEVSDGKGGTDSYSIEMNLVLGAVEWGEAVNNDPEIGDELIVTGPVGPVTDIYTNQVFELSVWVTDPDEDAFTHTWSSEFGEFHSDPNFPTVLWKTPATAGDYEIILTVNDSRGGVSTQTFTVTVQER
jgi:hypothetical protein